MKSLTRLLLALAAGAALFSVCAAELRSQPLDQLALGAETQTVLVDYQGEPVHCAGVGQPAPKCIAPALSRSLSQRVLWLGNSQLHAINQPQPGARTAPVLLAEQLRPLGTEVLGLSEPNASLQEHELMLAYAIANYQPTALILPAVFDDTREDRIRSELGFMAQDRQVLRILENSSIVDRLRSDSVADPDCARPFTPGCLQETVERAIDGALSVWPAWNARGETRGSIAVFMYQMRNTVFGIRPTSARRRISGAYQRNMTSLREILELAQRHRVHAIVYIAPIRQDVPLPYILSEYDEFKTQAAQLASAHGASFLNLEELVPPAFWGAKAATDIGGGQEIDFMHFQFRGHQLLAEAARRQLEADRGAPS
jgi:hypothetical protein